MGTISNELYKIHCFFFNIAWKAKLINYLSGSWQLLNKRSKIFSDIKEKLYKKNKHFPPLGLEKGAR